MMIIIILLLLLLLINNNKNNNNNDKYINKYRPTESNNKDKLYLTIEDK